MRLIRYDGPGARLRVAGRTIERGQTGEIPNRDAENLRASKTVRITVLGEQPDATDDEPTGTVEPEAAGEGQTDNDQEES